MSARLVWQINGGRAFLEGYRMRRLLIRPKLPFKFDFIEYSDEPDVVALKFVQGSSIPLNVEELAHCMSWLVDFFGVEKE